MNNCQLATITKGGRTVYQFVCYDNRDQASYIAGGVMDDLCDYHGGNDWDYQITTLPYVHSMTPPHKVVQDALSRAAI